MKIIIKNKIQCLNCNEILESKSRHDFVSCNCDFQTFVDGGNSYQRIGSKDLNKIKDLSEYKMVLDNNFMSRHDFQTKFNTDEYLKIFNNSYYTSCLSIVTTQQEVFDLHKDWKNSLQVVFKDVDDSTVPGSLTDELALKIVMFIKEKSLSTKMFITHCDMGVSRSAAIDLFIEECIKGNTIEDITRSKWVNYNKLVYKKLLKAYHSLN